MDLKTQGRGGEGQGVWVPQPGLSHPCPSDSSTEALTLNLTEVVKRQNPKSKKGFNQVRAFLSSLSSPQETYWACVCPHVRVYACVWEGVRGLHWGLWVGGEAGEGCAHLWGSAVAAGGAPSPRRSGLCVREPGLSQ